MAKGITSTVLVISLIAALIIGGIIGGLAFPQEVEVVKTVTKEVQVPVEIPVEVPVEVPVEYFGYSNFMESSWEIVLDEFDDDLKYCGGEKYDLDDEVVFEIQEDALFKGWFDFEHGKFEICYKVDGEYDDGDLDCEQTIKVCHKFKDFEPRNENYANVTIL